MSDPFRLSEAEIDRLIAEDAPYGDLTTRLAGIGNLPAKITFCARDPLVVSGTEEAARLLAALGAELRFVAAPSTIATPGTLLLEAAGTVGALQAGWKAAQTLMEWACGVASATHAIVQAAREGSAHVRVVCTRKTVPFTKALALKSVLAGGGEPHRVGLSDSVMLFAEHRQFLATPDDLGAAIAMLRQAAPEKSVMVEVGSIAEALAAAAADVIQVEKFSPQEVRQLVAGLVKRSDGRPIITAAGGIHAGNAAAYAAAGAEVLATSAPYAAKPTDIQVRFAKA